MSRGVRDDIEKMRAREKARGIIPTTEWGTDYWGEVLSEPNEEHARNVAAKGSNLYSRPPMGAWTKEDK